MGSGVDGDELWKCSTWKVDFYANFHAIRDFFWQRLFSKNVKGGFVTDKTGLTMFVL